jgi:hypothetical protein
LPALPLPIRQGKRSGRANSPLKEADATQIEAESAWKYRVWGVNPRTWVVKKKPALSDGMTGHESVASRWGDWSLSQKGKIMAWNIYRRDTGAVIVREEDEEIKGGFSFIREATESEVEDELARRITSLAQSGRLSCPR